MLFRVIPLVILSILITVVGTTAPGSFVYSDAFLNEVSESFPLVDKRVERPRPFLSFVETTSSD